MNFFPVPKSLAEVSAASAKASYDAKVKSRRGPGNHSTENLACYQMPDGKIRPCHDLYRPQYPEGSVPGIGTVDYVLRYYPNDTQGYDAFVRDFVPFDDLTLEPDNPLDASEIGPEY
jgi:hypothetical protein